MRASQIASWSGLELLEPLAGGARSTVFLARRGSTEYVVRASARSVEAIDWELDLQHHLDRHGVRVPRPVPADDGRHHVDGVMMQERLGGRPPRHVDDWARVVAALRAVHEATMGWPQRPGFDESRVDLPWFDFAHLPPAVPVPAPVPREQLITAGVAWEVATCWVPEPDYAAGRLEELRRRDQDQ